MARQRKTLTGLLQPLSRTAGPRGRAAGGANPALEAIWDAVCTIPHGRVATYGGVARAAGLPGRARQAGFALRVAADQLNLPWHRVVGAGGRIAFPPASRAHREQARRLRAEGVRVVEGRVARAALIELEEL
ncbi:MAG TPA: MGMT family protein [Steroidobacteraceae bacterium]|nr:MGMT family protein [Steroidobacteraceae bacterium]